MELEMRANAKINMALEVLGEREDGYHEIDTVMQEIDLCDQIEMETGRGGFALTCDNPALELNANNLIYRAWQLLRGRVADDSVIIHVEKHIPIAAGLAGGSSNAAATLVGLNRLWNLGLSDDELRTLGLELGSDVPFFIVGGTARARGRGEQLQTMKSFLGYSLVLLNIGKQVSSHYVYDRVSYGTNSLDELVERMALDSPKAFALMQNRMESVTFALLPELVTLREELERQGALVARMSGSGPTLFGLFEDDRAAQQAAERFRGRVATVLTAHTV